MLNRLLRLMIGVPSGAVAGAAGWGVMIAVTSGVCSVPLLKVARCTSPGASVPDSITLWDWWLLVAFVAAGVGAGWAWATSGDHPTSPSGWVYGDEDF